MNKPEESAKNIFELPVYAREFLDCKLYTEDGACFEINKIVCARKSLYFEMLFCRSFCNKTEFLIPDITKECLQEILRYLYTGKISLNSENVIDIMIAQNYLMITDMRTVIRENVKYALTNDNSFQLLTLSDLLNDTAIYRESFRFIQIHFQDLMCTQKEDFTNISLDILKSLLSTKNLSIDTEKSVWQAIEAWVEKMKTKRKRHVPLLLTCLALGDLDENLAKEIIEHDLIVNNSHVKKLSPSEDSSNGNHDRLRSIVITNNPHLMNNAFNYRIPEQLHLIGVIDPDNRHCCQLYLTYDENLDVWRKILDVDIQDQPPLPLLFNIENNLYALGGWREWAIDLRYGVSVSLTIPLFYNSSKELSVTALRNKIYFLKRINEFESETGVCAIDIYDCDTNSWDGDVVRFDIDYGHCVSVNECVYVIGCMENEGAMTAYVFDTTSPRLFEFPQRRWERIQGPAIVRFLEFQVVAYKHKIFVLGGRNSDDKILRSVEAFDVESHTWNQLDDLPFYCPTHWFNCSLTVILNDRLFVFDPSYEMNSKIVVWNDDLQKWRKLDVKGNLETFKWNMQGFQIDVTSTRRNHRQGKEIYYHEFCTIKDTALISALCKANRRLSFVRSHFNEKNTFQQDWFVK